MRRWRSLLLTTTALLAAGPVMAGPDGANVVGGNSVATVTGQGTANVTINQTQDRAIINWQHFNIGAGELTTFNQPNSGSVALNRVTGGLGPTEILGTLRANGRVFVVNRDGIYFGPNAVVDTSGFLATTNDISDANFMAGNYNFNIPGRPDASIVNRGTITASSAGFAALVAPGVRNTGTITATLGTVGLASGNSFTLDLYGDKLITLAVGDSIASQVRDVQTGLPLSSLVENAGRINADGGRVELSAAAARQIVSSVINNTGIIEANTIGQKGGQIVLSAATADTKPVDSPQQTIRLGGTISAAGKKSGEKGGKVVVTGENIELTGARIDVSGTAGGGTALIGGDWGGGNPLRAHVKNPSARSESEVVANAATVTVDAESTINASATENGNGGKVILWANDATSFAGAIEARGGPQGGDGGFAEVSGRQNLSYLGTVDLRAPQGSTGTLLLDTSNFEIWNGEGKGPETNAITNAALQEQLDRASVVIQTRTTNVDAPPSDIQVNANVSWANNSTLTLSAQGDIRIADNRTISNTGAGNLVLRADNGGSENNAGTVHFMSDSGYQSTARIDWSGSTGTVNFYFNPSGGYLGSQANGENFRPFVQQNGAVTNQFTAWMLVNTPQNLSNVRTNLSGNYALGTNISASVFEGGFQPIGGSSSFIGRFDGLGNTISNLTIALEDSGLNNLGLFGRIGQGGSVSNLTLSNVTVVADPYGEGSQYLGTLAGQNFGTIRNVTVVNSTINGRPLVYEDCECAPTPRDLPGLVAGGVVGHNGGAISNTTAAVTVTAGSGNFIPFGEGPGSFGFVTPVVAGGLAGTNAGTITDSSASGAVSGGSYARIGGLVGRNEGTITDGRWSGVVTVTGSDSLVGGLVGQNESIITSSAANVPTQSQSCASGFSCATGTVSVGSQSIGGGLVGNNSGSITNAFTQNVTIWAAAGTNARPTVLGGLAGQSSGTITGSLARASMLNSFQDNLLAGGLVGHNTGTISGSQALIDIAIGNHGVAGGLVGQNRDGTIANSSVSGATFAPTGGGTIVGGFAAETGGGVIVNTGVRTAGVTGGAETLVGGLVGVSDGSITQSNASVRVEAGANSIVGGLVGFLQHDGSISQQSSASGAVTGTGANSIVGGLVGLNLGSVGGATVAGETKGNTDSHIGGLVGINLGRVENSSTGAAANVTGTGAGNIVGGLVGLNAGTLDLVSVHAATVSGGSRNTVGGLVGANVALTGLPPNAQLAGSSFPVGSIARATVTAAVSGGEDSVVGGVLGRNGTSLTGLTATNAVTGGPRSTVGGLAGVNAGPNSIPGLPSPLAQSLVFGVSSAGGTIERSQASGSVNGGVASIAGGLVGQNPGTISESHATGNVSIVSGMAGGLVGQNGTANQQGPQTAKIVNSYAHSNVSVGFAEFGGWSYAGGLVGRNYASITGSSAGAPGNERNTVSGGPFSFVGGFVGQNDGTIGGSSANVAVSGTSGSPSGESHASTAVGGFAGANTGTISHSSATGPVSGDGTHDTIILGGFVGLNGLTGAGSPTGKITDSQASGTVTATGQGQVGGFAGGNFAEIRQSSASGAVSTEQGTAGGFVGFNSVQAMIDSSHAIAKVTANAQGQLAFATAGGFVGENQGTITNAYATGNVSANAEGVLGGATAGGFAGSNQGTITTAYATGNVTVGGLFAVGGGFVGENHGGEITNAYAAGLVTGTGDFVMLGGFAGTNAGTIQNAAAIGSEVTATGGVLAVVGGFVGMNSGGGEMGGGIFDSTATSTVSSNSEVVIAGGFVGMNGGFIDPSFATGNVNIADAAAGYGGGFAGMNIGELNQVFALGKVTGGDNSVLGGLVGANLGSISQAYSTGAVTGGANSLVGGLAGLNLGNLDQTYAAGRVTGGSGSTLGGLVAENGFNGFLGQLPPEVQQQLPPGSELPQGTATNSYWDTQTTGQQTSKGGTGLTTAAITAGLPAGFDPAVWTNCADGRCYPYLPGQEPDTIPTSTRPPENPTPPQNPDPPQSPCSVQSPCLPQDTPPPQHIPEFTPPQNQPLVVANLVQQINTQLSTPAEVVTPPQQTSQGGSGGQGGRGGSRPGGDVTGGVGPLRPDGRPSNIPPLNEMRFISNQVLVQIAANVPPEVLERIARRLGLSVLSSQSLGLLGARFVQFQFGSGKDLRAVIKELEKLKVIDEASPNYEFELARDATAPEGQNGDASQYIIEKLKLAEVHRIATGENVKIAVIDSEIDAKHPDLEGRIAARYEEVGPVDRPHSHGTGMAGAIVSHRKLIGTAPGARILAIRAFGGPSGGKGTTMQIVKGLDWAISQNARIVNMSFAGPKDPTLSKAFKAAYDRGIVLIAAAGNAGPKSPPLYPGADPNVIAVSATDADDQIYSNSNRGKYVSVAAPGVDVLVPAPDGNYEFTTGTSVAAAHVSGVAALLLQRDPKLDPAGVRELLTATADPIGTNGRSDEFGSGRIDPLKALQAVGAKTSGRPAPVVAAAR